jgi:8-oxo-dGTP diphosphatase
MLIYMSKPIKYVVAVVLRNANNPKEFLTVKRPDSDKDLGGCWGLPAASMKDGELPEAAARRVCREKLDCDAESVRFIGIMQQTRNAYDICLMDIEMQVVGNQQPEVSRSTSPDTVYVAQKWSTDPLDVMASAKKGSCCSSIFLTDQGLLDREDWVLSLEGSKTVG